MPFDLFQDENLAQNLPKNGSFQAGVNDFDPGPAVEQGIQLPFVGDPQASWLYYDVNLEIHLDSGIVVHRILPQVDNDADSLGSSDIYQDGAELLTGAGVNLKSEDSYLDVVQRMAHSQYFFRLFGKALRVGFQVPIPKIVALTGGQPVIPYDAKPQYAYNKIVGNYAGQVLWQAEWSLWYTLAEPPTTPQEPPPAFADHIGADAVSEPIQAAFSLPDDKASVSQGPVIPPRPPS